MLSRLSRDFHRSLTLLKAQDFYKILGVKKNSQESDIKKAYFDLAKKFHPDINKSADSKDKFSEISTAYETLGDKTKRKIYDTTGLNADEQFHHDSQSHGFEDFNDFYFEQEEPRRKRGEDITISIEISFMESIEGCTKSISFEKLDTCVSCKGTRAKSGTSPLQCSMCNGYGVILMQRGPMSVQTLCEKCGGLGTIIKHLCPPCKGKGFSKAKATENVRIPAGIDNGATLKMSQKGGISKSKGVSGDLLVKLRVKEHSVLKRKGFDIHSMVKLKMGHAALGGSAAVETLKGKIEVEVQPGLNNSEKLRISNYGVPHLPPNSSSRGHHYVEFQVEIPKNLNARQKNILQQLAVLENNQ